MNEAEQTDLDETRRLCVMAKIGLLAGRKLSVDLVGTLVHALVYHSDFTNGPWADDLGIHLLHGNQNAAAHLEPIIDTLNKRLWPAEAAVIVNLDEPAE